MIFYVLNDKYQTLDILDTFAEATWNVFFRDEGNCDIYLPAHKYAGNEYLKAGNYLMTPDSDRYMVIEDFETQHDIDEDPILIVSGRSLESLLDRRVIWDKILFEKGGSVQDFIKRIVTENLISPAIGTRKIDGFEFSDSTDESVTSKILDSTYELHGDNVLEAVRTLCSRYDLGFKVLPSGEGGFKMSLYAGKDRSYQQDILPWVTFSPEYENIESTKLIVKNSKERNAVLMYNEHDYTESTGQTSIEHHVVYSENVSRADGEVSGIARRELFIQSSKSHNKDDDSNTMYTVGEYTSIIQSEGREELANHSMTSVFSGKVETLHQFLLGRDFDLGDIVQVKNEYGMSGRCRIAEVLYSHNESGERVIPYFTNVGSDDIMT